MHAIIDVPQNVAPYAARLAAAGVTTVIRYYNHANSSTFPTKCLTAAELNALHGAGLSVAVVFQQRGGAGGNIADLSAANGTRDGTRALTLATKIGQPKNSAIYFAVDWDYYRPDDLARIASYFENVRKALGSDYLVGVYGSGTVGRHLARAGLVEHVWLSGSLGWSGTRAALEAGDWSLFQKYMELRSEIGGFGYDGNVVNTTRPGFGQFGGTTPLETPRGEGYAALFRVNARTGLNLRSGPGDTFRILASLPEDTLITGLAREGDWIKVDQEGDGLADGYMFAGFLEAVTGGLPLALTSAPGVALRPIDIARAELKLDIREYPGRDDNNPRIQMYHATTTLSRPRAELDETAWCSSFVNFCVEQAGLRGTRSAWALDWRNWGQPATDPREGDIAVFSRKSAKENGGHVGFVVSVDSTSISVLGGNQSNRICIDTFPRKGRKGSYDYELITVRQA